MKNLAALAALGLLLSLLLLSGCAVQSYHAGEWQEADLPVPYESSMENPNTDSVPRRTMDVELYLRSADGAMLMPVSRTIQTDYTDDPAQAIVQALLSASEDGMTNPFPQGTRVLSVEHTGGVVTVDLSIDAYNVSAAQELLWMDAALANTLGALEDVEYVNMLIGGRKYSLDGLGMGAQDVNNANVTLLWTHSRTELDYLEQDDSSLVLQRKAIVYYPALSDGSLLPVSVDIAYTQNGEADALITALSIAPDRVGGVCAAYAVPPQYAISTVVTEDGRRVLKINFTAESWSTIQQNKPGMACAATALTLVSFVPEIDGVAFCADDMLITEFDLQGETLTPDTGILTRETLRSRIGDAVELYYASADSNLLTRVTRVLSPMVERYPRTLLSLLMQGPAASDAAVSAFPEGITTEDILGISLQNGVMQVNLSANFYRLCQPLDGDAERKLVYAIVNTLCGLEDVEAVQFFVEGEQAEVLSESIYLRVPLMPNPGLALCSATTTDVEGE